MTEADERKSIDAGAAAYRIGAPIKSNPYPEGSAEHSAWGAGWLVEMAVSFCFDQRPQ